MDYLEILAAAKAELTSLDSHLVDVLDIKRPQSLDYAKNLAKVISKLSPLLENMIEPYKIIAKSKHINMNIDYSNSLIINTDKILLNKVLSNIISNAVKLSRMNWFISGEML